MKHEVSVPSVGESVSQGVLASWLKKEGEWVEQGEDLFELETDKASMAVPSPASGVLSVQAQEGDEISVGQVVAALDDEAKPSGGGKVGAEADGTAAAAEAPGRTAPPSEAGNGKAREGAAPAAETPPSESPRAAAEERKPAASILSPAVRRIVEENALNPQEISGTGPGGRITKEDALAAAEGSRSGTAAAGSTGAVPKEPVPRRPEVEPARRPETGTSRRGAPQDRQQRVPMTTIRKAIARGLVQSQREAAHLTTFNEIDMLAVMTLRSAYREEFEKRHGVRLGFMSFFVKACCSALEEFPEVNARIDGEEIVYNNYYDIGVAVSTERGLLVPVIRDADSLGLAEIERTVGDLAVRGRDKKLKPDELTGGTFTITNGGVFGSLLSTPIPNHPQSAILGMHTIQKRPVAVNDQVVIRPMMYVAMTYDHRIIDGRTAVSFLVRLKQLIEDPQRLLLDI